MLIEAQLKSMWSWRNKLQIMNLRGGLTKTKTHVDTIQYFFSPALILQQKRNQLVHLDERIKQQEENLEALGEQT